MIGRPRRLPLIALYQKDTYLSREFFRIPPGSRRRPNPFRAGRGVGGSAHARSERGRQRPCCHARPKRAMYFRRRSASVGLALLQARDRKERLPPRQRLGTGAHPEDLRQLTGQRRSAARPFRFPIVDDGSSCADYGAFHAAFQAADLVLDGLDVIRPPARVWPCGPPRRSGRGSTGPCRPGRPGEAEESLPSFLLT